MTRMAKDLAEKYNTCVLVSIYLDQKDDNPHANIVLPTRDFCQDSKKFTKKIRVLDDKMEAPGQMQSIRDLVIDRINELKEKSNSLQLDKRVIHKGKKKYPLASLSRYMPDDIISLSATKSQFRAIRS